MPSQVAQIQHGGAVHAVRWRATGVCAEDVSCPVLIVPAVACPRRCTAQPQPAARPGSRQRYCRCGKPLSGRALKLNGTEVCKGCERDHYRGLPPIYKAAKLEAVPAAAAAAAPRPDPVSPPPNRTFKSSTRQELHMRPATHMQRPHPFPLSPLHVHSFSCRAMRPWAFTRMEWWTIRSFLHLC